MTSQTIQRFCSIRFLAGTASVLAIATLAACGGGGSGSGNTIFSETGLSVKTAVGTYATACARRGESGEFKLITATFADAGQDKGAAVVHYRTFGQDANCADSSVTFDITGNFDVTPSAVTKEILATADRTFAGFVHVAEAKLTGFKLSKGGYAFPSFGASTKVGYSANGTVIRFVSGKKGIDDLGNHFSDIVLTKVS